MSGNHDDGYLSEDSANFVVDQEADGVYETAWHCTVHLCCPCCASRLLDLRKEEIKLIKGVISFIFLLWAIGPLWWRFFEFVIPAYQVGSTYEGGDPILFAHGLWLDDLAIIFSPDDISYANSSETHVEYAVSGQCRTFSGCLYDGPIYPTGEGRFHRFGGSQHPIMTIAMVIALIGLTLFLCANQRYGKVDSELYKYFQDNQQLADTLNVGRYIQDDWRLLWSFLKFWILSFLNCALTLPNGTKMVDGCLRAGGFFLLRQLIYISYVFVASVGSFVVLLFLFICNVLCFDEELELHTLKFSCKGCCGRRRDVKRTWSIGQEDDKGEYKERTCLSLFLDAIRQVVKGSKARCTCGCRQYQYRCFFTVGAYLQFVLGILTFLGFLVFLISGLSGLMGIINGMIDDPLKNSGQLVWWWFDLFKYCMNKKRTNDKDSENPPIASVAQECQTNETECGDAEKKSVELACQDDEAITPGFATFDGLKNEMVLELR